MHVPYGRPHIDLRRSASAACLALCSLT
ncbi:MAG: putative leader peptide [Actinomycetes bacterium]